MAPQTLAQSLPRSVSRATPRRGERADLVVWIIIIHMLVAVAHVNAMFTFLLPLRPGLVSIVFATALYVLRPTGPRSLGVLFRQRPVQLMIALLAWATFSIPAALNRGVAFSVVTDNFLKVALLFLLLVGIVRGVKDLERLAFWYMVGTILYAVYALQNLDMLLASGGWRFNSMALGGYDANDFALFCVSGLPFAVHFIRRSGQGAVRLIALFGIPVLGAAIVFSGSRGAFLAAAAVGIFVLVRFRSIRLGWRVAAVAAAAITIVATAGDQYWEQMKAIGDPEQDYNRTAVSGRIQTWQRGLGYAAQFPITGLGAGNFGMAEGTVATELRRLQEQGIGTPWNTAHNTYVQVLAELGVPGAVLFVWLLGAAWREMRRAERNPPTRNAQSLVQATKASTLGMLVGILFLSHAYTPMLYVLLAFAAAAGKTMGAQIPSLSRGHAGERVTGRRVLSTP